VRIGPERDPLPRLLAFVYAPLALAAWWLLEHRDLLAPDRLACPLLKYTGVACPTCGGTRAGLALARLRVSEAFAENPLIALMLILLGLWLIYAVAATLAPRLRGSVRLAPGEHRLLRVLALGLVLGTWIYEIVRHA